MNEKVDTEVTRRAPNTTLRNSSIVNFSYRLSYMLLFWIILDFFIFQIQLLYSSRVEAIALFSCRTFAVERVSSPSWSTSLHGQTQGLQHVVSIQHPS